MKHNKTKGATWRLSELVERVERPNSEGIYSYSAVRGVSNTKEIQKTKANIEGRSLLPFHIIKKGEFVFNRRTTRNGDRLGLGFNDTDEIFLFTEDYVAFHVKDEKVLLPNYLYLVFLRPEFDRYVRWDSWGSATEFFNWENMCRIEIPVPSLDVQQEVVEAWQGLRKMKEENEGLVEPLLALCRSYLQECKKKYPMKEIGPFIGEENLRNDNAMLDETSVRGLSTAKEMIDTAANLEGVSLSSYKCVSPRRFAYVSDTSRRGDRMSLGFNSSDNTYLVSSISTVFAVDESKLNAEFLYLWILRPEFDRYARFNSWGSARETFTWSDMCRVKIPLPPIEVQQAIVDVYRCANEAKQIAAEADRLSREICPALVRWAAEGGGE